MQLRHIRIHSFVLFALGAFLVICVASVVSRVGASPLVHGFPEDWTHHHVNYTEMGTAAEALARGKFTQWYRAVTDPRFQIQQMRRARAAHKSGSFALTPEGMNLLPDVSAVSGLSAVTSAKSGADKLSKDWQEVLGAYTSFPTGQYPAKWNFTDSATCSDYVVYPTGVAGSGTTQATITAFTDLYPGMTGCTSGPSTYWAYNTGGGLATLSPVLGLSGNQVAYVQTVSGTAYLILLTMANSGSTVKSLSATAATSYHGCSAPCYTQFSLGTTDSNSSPFYNYGTDTLYVGDDSGNLHQFTTVFNGTPTVGWTTNVTTASGETAKHLTGPVVDPNSGTIFVSSNSGYLHSLSATGSASSETTAEQNDCGTAGLTDSPLIDTASSTSYVYIFISYGCDTDHHSYINVFDAAEALTLTSYGTYQEIGTGSTAQLVYAGSFDNQHTTADNGNLYVCMGDETDGTHPTLYQVAIGGTTTPSLTLHSYSSTANGAATCTPVTEYYNGTHDWVFLSVTASGNQTVSPACTGACIYNYSVPTNTTTHTGTATAGLAVTGGSSAIIIDNNSASPGSNIYFNSLGEESCNGAGTRGCAVQASQAAP
ncbi:MAG: hypothetical protein ACLQVG_04130 [Terriglobia bacterium]